MPLSTTKITASLYQLQQLDLELDRCQADIRSLEQSLKGNLTVQRLRHENEIAQQQLAASQQSQREAEWTLSELNRQVQQHEQRLYSGIITHPRELASLQQEIQHLRASQNRQEELVLELLDSAESLEQCVQQKSQELQKAESQWAQENMQSIEKQASLTAQQRELEVQRLQAVEALDASILTRYTQMRRTKQGQAVSKVEHNSCQWCRVILTPNELQRVRLPEIQTCSNCGRILYYER